MKTIGFPVSTKENEKRRAIVPSSIVKLTHPEQIYIERGFGDVLGISDDEYRSVGCRICNRYEVLEQDIVCDPKVGDASYLGELQQGQAVFGWIHATQNREITDKIIDRGLTAFAWEKMYEMGRHVFWFNNELAGEAAVIHGFQCYGRLPYGLDVAVIGNGNTAKGATKVLNMLGARVIQYGRKQESLLRDEISQFDVIVNCIMWDVMREDHVISKEDLKRMKRGSMIIDVSCDKHGGIETSEPTTINNPTYYVEGILHYAVDHTPAIFFKTFSYENSLVIYPYIEKLINEDMNEVLMNCMISSNGIIVDPEIKNYQHR